MKESARRNEPDIMRTLSNTGGISTKAATSETNSNSQNPSENRRDTAELPDVKR
jgi:hypothetical protein